MIHPDWMDQIPEYMCALLSRCPTCFRRLDDRGSCHTHGTFEPREQDPDSPSVAITPPTIPGYQTSRLLGTGGYAAVFEAHHEASGDPVALKVAHTGEARAWQRFAREADALSRIPTPFVPGVISSQTAPPASALPGAPPEDAHRPFIAMELVTAPILGDWLAARTEPPSPQTAIAIMDALLAALEAVHSAGVIHRDLKPENAFLHRTPPDARSGGRSASTAARTRPFVTLFDFGLATGPAFPEDPLTSANHAVGSIEYMAPEQILTGAEVDHRADIYGFGSIAFELVTLRPPFVGTAPEITDHKTTMRPPRPRSFATIAESLEQLILACLARDPGRRPGSVAEVRAMLDHSARSLSSGRETMVTLTDNAPAAKRSAGGYQAVVLLGATSPIGLRELEHHLSGTGGVVARSDKKGFVCAFSGFDLEDPISAAATAARQLHDAGVRALCLHIDRVLVRRSRRGTPRLYGAAIHRPENWLPDPGAPGVAVTGAIGDLIPPQVVDQLPRFHRIRTTAEYGSGATASPPGDEPGHPVGSLVGRESLVADALQTCATVIADRRPGLITLLGAAGMGKSRLLAELRARLGETWSDADRPMIIELDARRSAGNPVELIEQLVARLASDRDRGPDDRTHGADADKALIRALHDRAKQAPVALFLDNGHLAHDRVLDSIEQSTLDGLNAPILAVVAADPRLEDMRLRWGGRAHHHDRRVLEALPEPDAVTLCRQMLWPVEYPPTDVVRRLAGWSGGVPGVIAELVNTLKREGHIKRRTGTDSWYVATTTLDSLPASPAREWLVGRTVSSWPRELGAFAGLCACIGPGIRQNELEWIQEHMEVAGESLSDLDAQVGIEALVDRDILVGESRGYYAFRSESFRDAAYQQLDEGERRRAHHYALAYWREAAGGDTGPESVARDPETSRLWARHAALAGQDEEAATLYLRLADRAARRHRYIEADQHYSATLDALDGALGEDRTASALHPVERVDRSAETRIQALWGRSRMRCRTYRLDDAMSDIHAAIELAGETIGERSGGETHDNVTEPAPDRRTLAQLWLEKAMIQDWAEDFPGSRASGERAAEIAGSQSDAPGLRARLRLAQARQLARASQLEEAIPILVDTVELARSDGDIESRIIALVLLAPYLVILGHPERAAPRFEEVIELCEEHGDTLHLCAAYSNRMLLWTYSGRPDQSIDDLVRTTRLAREAGIPLFERMATYNLAELLYWLGQDDEALERAERAKHLQERFVGGRLADDDVLLARILLSRDQFAAARDRLDDLARHNRPTHATPMVWLLFRALSLVLAERGARPAQATPGDSWDSVVRDARAHLAGQELIEILYWRIRSSGRLSGGPKGPDDLAALWTELDELARDAPVWTTRVARLA